MTAVAPRRTRHALFLGCALAALGQAGRADAQAFNGNPTVVAGSVSRSVGPNVETITIDSPTAIINWVPTVAGDPIIFLPSGNVATFTNGSVVNDFAVLNRIFANVPVRFDGTVISLLQDFAVGNTRPGGTIIFQSPAGIIVGSKALFDVGNLILTSLDVADDGAGNFMDSTGAIRFAGGDKAPTAAVITEPGARILASSEGSYVAMIAPVVQHGGNLQVNGSAAYVAAEQVEFRVNAGLFDIIVGTGSANAVPLMHTGTTGGPASTGAGDVHNIYLVAVPKNQAITAILQGNIGYEPAISAAVENGAIILSAGHSVAGGAVDRYGDASPPPAPDLAASFEIRGGTVTSDLTGVALTDMLASGSALGVLDFKQDVSLFAGRRAHLFAGAGQMVTVAGDALISTARMRSADGSIDLTGGESAIFALAGGTVDIAGGATVDAAAQGAVDVAAMIAGNGTGGTATIYADGGNVHIAGPTRVRATGAGGTIDFVPNQGGTGQGGAASIEGRNGGTVTLDDALVMNAGGTGSRSNGSLGLPGANGTGGTARVAAIGGGTVTVGGSTTISASGLGGEVTGGMGILGGTGQGGTVTLSAAGTVSFAGDPELAANGDGGAGPVGGIGNGGVITLAASGAGGMLTAGNVSGTVFGNGQAATGNSPGHWHVTAGTGSSVRLRNLSLTAFTNGPGATLPFSSLEPLGGSIIVTQTATLATPADIRVIGSGAGSVTGALLDMDAGGDILVTHTARGANFTIDVTDLDMDAQNVTVSAGAATRASNRTDVAAVNALTVGGVMDGREIVTTAASANVLAGGTVGGPATELTDIRATGNAAVAGTILGRNILLVSNALNVGATGAIGGANTDQTELRTTTSAAIAGRVLGRSILSNSATLNVAATGAVGDAATQLSDLRATGAAGLAGTVLGQSINVQGAAVTVAAGGTVGGTGTNQTRVTATGNAAVAGTVLGGDILVTSNALTLSGTVGGAGTTRTELRTTGNSAITGRTLGRTILVTAGSVNVGATGAVGDGATLQTTIDTTGGAVVAGTVAGGNILVASNTLDLSGTVGGAGTTQTELRTTGNSTITGRALGGTILVTAGNVNVGASGSVGDGATAQTTINTPGNATIAGTVRGGNILVASNALDLSGTVGGAGTTQNELRTTGNGVITGSALGGTILVTAANVTVGTSGAVGDAATTQATINTAGNAAIAGTVRGGSILVASNALDLSGTVGGVGTTQNELRTTGNSTISGRVLGQSILATAAALNVSATGAVGDATTQQTDLRATGNASVAGTVLGRTINVQGATLALAAGGTIGGAGTDQTRLTSLGNTGVAGTVLGRDIQITSTDIDLTGSVGNAATQLVTLAVGGVPAPGQFTVLGGTAAGPGYTLTNAEAGRIRADALRITVPALGTAAGRPPDLIVRDLTLAGGGAASGIGTLNIVTPGIARVEGNLLMAGARAADGISFTATQRLEVPTPIGSIRVRDAAGGPGGTLLLASNNLWVTSAAIIDRLRLDPNYAGRDAELLDNGGADVPRGYVEGGAVTLNTGGTLFVQNTGFGMGTFATGLAFGGVTVGPGGLTVRATGGVPATVTAFGRRLNADGSFTTGYDFFFGVNFQAGGGGAPGAGFTAASTFNTCIIVGRICPARPPNNAVPGRDPTTGPTGDSDSIQLPPGSEADDLVDTSFSTDQLIEEPVTSGGESIIWEEDCDRDNDGDCDEVRP